jgi:hypothetical protein
LKANSLPQNSGENDISDSSKRFQDLRVDANGELSGKERSIYLQVKNITFKVGEEAEILCFVARLENTR